MYNVHVLLYSNGLKGFYSFQYSILVFHSSVPFQHSIPFLTAEERKARKGKGSAVHKSSLEQQIHGGTKIILPSITAGRQAGRQSYCTVQILFVHKVVGMR